MKTIHNFKNPKGKQAAANDHSLNCTAFAVFSLISDYMEVNGSMRLTSKEMSGRWSLFSKTAISVSIVKLKEAGYLEEVKSQDLFNMTRILVAAGDSVTKPTSKKAKDTAKRDELFDKLWSLYNRGSNKPARRSFEKLTISQCEKALRVAPSYVASVSDKTYLKHVSTWLNQESFNDEIEKPKPQGYQSVVKYVTPVKTNAQIKEERDEHDRWVLMRAERQKAREDRWKEFGYKRPFPTEVDKKVNDSRVKRGMPSDIEAVLTARLKRERKQYKK